MLNLQYDGRRYFAINSSTGVIESRNTIDYDTMGRTKFLMLKIVAVVCISSLVNVYTFTLACIVLYLYEVVHAEFRSKLILIMRDKARYRIHIDLEDKGNISS